MNLLHAVDQPQSDINSYVGNLDRILLEKMDMIGKLRQKLVTFYTHLRQEENLQRLYQQKQQDANEEMSESFNPGFAQDENMLDSENDGQLQDSMSYYSEDE